MRSRSRILGNLESLYQEAFSDASETDDKERMTALDFEYQRDQLWFEVLLDLRVFLTPEEAEEEEGPSLLDKAKKIRDLTKLTKLR